MTLDEAILHSEQIADSYKDTEPNCKCAKEHRQLAEWLKELKHLRVIEPKQADDLISRADALAYPISWDNYDKRHGDTKFVCGVESYREYIEHLPSAQPNWFEAAIPPEDGEVYINENGCAIMGAKTFWEMKKV